MIVNQSDNFVIKAPTEFSFNENMRYIGRSPNECMFEIQDNKIIRLIPALDETLLVEISENSDGNLLVRFLEKLIR